MDDQTLPGELKRKYRAAQIARVSPNFRPPPRGGLRKRFGFAQMSGSGFVPLMWEYRQRVADNDPEALGIYLECQRQALGDDPLADRPFQWPEELAEPGTVLEIPESAPVTGWRMWAVQDGWLAAPFMTIAHGLDLSEPGARWQPGVNSVAPARCPFAQQLHQHPDPECWCGIRAVQARSVLDPFAKHMRARHGGALAIAQVSAWGRVASYTRDDDWVYTLRAEHAQIVGPVEIGAEHHAQSVALSVRYGVDVVTVL